MLFFQKFLILRAISSAAPGQIANPYRQILRRRVPEPLLALLIFLMGVFLWDNHFGVATGYEQGTCQMALLKSDRDLRLAEATTGLPGWLRWSLAIPDREEALETAVASLDALGREGALDGEGAYALVILDALRRGDNPADGLFTSFGLPGRPDPNLVLRRIEKNEDSWWDREYLREIKLVSESQVELHAGTADGDPRNRELALRAVVARGGVWLLVMAGSVCLPAMFRSFRAALKSTGRGYPGRWPIGLGLGVFLMAYLASLGFGKLLDWLISGALTGDGKPPIPLSPPVFVLLDGAARFLPALVAVGFLFRGGGHAISRLGLNAKPEGRLVLGSFALVTFIDLVLQRTVGPYGELDPSGGLSPMEVGRWGLVMTVTSACLAAPIAEEILFRGVLFRSLANRLRIPAATLLSAAVFSLVHFYDAYGLMSVGVLGAACALCFASSGRLTSAILLHMLYNSAIKIPEWIVYHAPL
ncbi:CPBP family glutamic-type intramembrane protease [Luteolibacter marinus]|uniref:CPBP family glutamic-type intramembrane protease n=1 Tax=Luteolibacter marinus TaxID=2776705 RepID=UPI00186779EA|nr:CPBP family glutamic-type intramembrane protease [Luteolibacter marinus]